MSLVNILMMSILNKANEEFMLLSKIDNLDFIFNNELVMARMWRCQINTCTKQAHNKKSIPIMLFIYFELVNDLSLLLGKS